MVPLRVALGAYIPIPTPDDAVKYLLTLVLGGSGFVLFAAFLLWSIYSWYSTLRDVTQRGKDLGAAVQGAWSRMRRTDPAARLLAITGMALMLASQAIWLATTYVVGNVISVMFMLNKKINQSPGAPPPSASQAFHALQLDAISGVYLIIAVIGIVVSYRHAIDDNGSDAATGIGCLLSIPGYASLGLGLLFFVLTWFLKDVAHDPGYTSREIALSILAAVVGAAYAASCHFVLQMPAKVIRQRSRTLRY